MYVFGYGTLRVDMGHPPADCTLVGRGVMYGVELLEIDKPGYGRWASVDAVPDQTSHVIGDLFRVDPDKQGSVIETLYSRERVSDTIERSTYWPETRTVLFEGIDYRATVFMLGGDCDVVGEIKSGDWKDCPIGMMYFDRKKSPKTKSTRS